ncbi:MAG: amidase [Deltaproteobacteria bacterium]|nr:amidase [Deltaproteobacteria bacterium]MBT4263432.1 amidase [Deltaproteobacteria bacterium]MBT4638409.1 amidase [Deltaproteobacteria bacterium]MBT6502127.1 amidase [Deltaproteobacteria bacterium]MBT7151744.1 amidase [Deltaproteobacteria bacterium]
MKDELIDYDAIALGELIRKGEIKPTELLEVVIQRIERLNPKLNAVIHKMYDQARDVAAEVPPQEVFSGVPFLLKDLFAEYEGTPFEEGSRAVKGHVSRIDSEIVKRQKAAGLNIVGKTNTCEFGLLPTTEPKLHGPTLNPWNPGLTPGGSSGGSAAAVAAGIVPMAHGNDGGGSIRCPASCCGLFGLKPTRGRNPLGPLFGDVGGGLAHEHAVTLTVRDSAALLDVTSGPDLGDPYCAPPKERPYLEEVGLEPDRLKIGFLNAIPEGWSLETKIHPDCQSAVKDAASLCESLGHIVAEIDPQELSHPNLNGLFGQIFTCLTGRMFAYWEEELGRKITEDQVEAMTWAGYQAGLKRTGADYLACVEKIQLFSRKIARWYHQGEYDLLLSPTLSIPPVKLGSFDPTPADPMSGFKTTSAFVALTYVQNITGQPAMSVPLFWNENNLPIGVQFAGRFGDEATLFRLAAQLEQARPWIGRKPAIHISNNEK